MIERSEDLDTTIHGQLGVFRDDGVRVQCHLCGKWFLHLGSHTFHVHGLTADWLATRCERVAVVAHSQGAAVAHSALEDAPANVVRFITFGSGLNKLTQLHQARQALSGGARAPRPAADASTKL